MSITLEDVLLVWPGARACDPGEVAEFKADGPMALPPLNLIASAKEVGEFQGMIELNQKKYSLEYGFKKSKSWGDK